MSALLLAVGLAALILAGIITGALWLVHHGNAGQFLLTLSASVNSFCQQLLSIYAKTVDGIPKTSMTHQKTLCCCLLTAHAKICQQLLPTLLTSVLKHTAKSAWMRK